MSIDPLTALFDIGSKALDKFVTTPKEKAEALERMQKLKQEGELAEMQAYVSLLIGQVEINKKEAEHPSIFVAGWRPAIGWVCAASLFTYYVPYCLAAAGIWIHQCAVSGSLVERPDLNIADLVGLVAAMLGVGLPRTYEKIKDVATFRTQK